MNTRLNFGSGVSGAVRYVFGPGRDPKTGELKSPDPDTPSRVAWIGGQGFGFTIKTEADADLARRMMEFSALNQASKTRQCEQDCVHLSLAWAPGEKPTQAQMEDAARGALKALGMENAEALFVSHNDEEYAHVHIVASRINPATGRAYDLYGSYRTLSRWAQEHELENGGIISTRRQDANELRDAIAKRDAAGVLDALTKQRSTFTDSQLHRALEKEIIRPGDRDARAAYETELVKFRQEILARPELVELSATKGGPTDRYTTRTVLQAEMQVLRAAGDLAGSQAHQIDATRLAAEKYARMNPEQAAAFRHVTGQEGLAIIDGQAGTGKSFTLAGVRDAYQAAGFDVIGLGPTNKVVKNLSNDGFDQARTIHSELFALNNGRTAWTAKTVIVVDEAAMLDTKLMAMVTAYAADAKAKLILVGDDRQLSSIDRGGMFGALKDRFGAAEISTVMRQQKVDDRRAAEHMARGNFHDALGIYDQKGAIHWTRTQSEARAELVDQWAKDTAAQPDKTRFVFTYTNADVAALNAELRAVRKGRGELGDDHTLKTATGTAAFAAGDRLQFNGTDKKAGIVNGDAGTVTAIDGTKVTVRLDGPKGKSLTFDADHFGKFRHGYAGTIYAGQGSTLDQSYLYHTEHWRSAASYVALTRHRDQTQLFVARNTAKDVKELARQMARVDDKRAASMFHPRQGIEPARDMTPAELLAEIAPADAKRARDDDRAPKPEAVTDWRMTRERTGDSDLERERRMPGRYDDLTRDRGERYDDLSRERGGDGDDLERGRPLRR